MGLRRTHWVCGLLVALILVIAPAFAARAQIVEDFAGSVPGIPGKTWLDLMDQVFTDIKASTEPNVAATASGLADKVHSVAGADDSWMGCVDPIKIASLDAHPLRLGGQDRLVVAPTLADECAALLALFDDKGGLVDVINLKGDQHGGLGANFLTPLGPAGALVTATNWHDNSDQSYDATILVLVKADGFSSIDTLLAFGSRDCTNMFTEQAKVDAAPGTGPMPRLDAAVTRESHRFAADCKTKIGREVKTTFNGYWRWNPKKGAYEAHTRELDLLAKWNEKHF